MSIIIPYQAGAIKICASDNDNLDIYYIVFYVTSILFL